MKGKQLTPWYAIEDEGKIDSPALLIYPERIAQNIRNMLVIAGDPDRLRPHIKTHKMVEIIRMQQDAGIRKFKCATLAEAELLAQCKAEDVLVAYPLIGPGPARLASLQKNLDTWLEDYNTLRTHQGNMCCGQIPMATLLDGKTVWKKSF